MQFFHRESMHHTHPTSSLETTHTEQLFSNLLEGEGGMERRQQLQLLLLIHLLHLQTPRQTTV